MGATENPNEGLAQDPTTDPLPVTHWTQEVGPSLVDAAKAMLGFATGIV